ncbi:hypothetical protein AB0M46_05690 [Dactylosporangium sp. NPDC051485]
MTQPTNPEPTNTDRNPTNWAPWIFLAAYALGLILGILDAMNGR